MNRFRTKKKVKEESVFAPRASHESDSPTPFRLFGKGKKSQEEEPKPELDLENALPPSDDFRTSLLMTGLSARFSMLREQDDPHSKLGKASDDSVLFPRRQSRMDFGLGASSTGLSDIAEVASIRKEIPFARMDSYHSADGSSISGSVMDRPKPGEGNNLFGGRQKVYMLASGASSSKTLGVGGMSGRVLYDDDVSQSAFQKWRQAEKNKLAFDDDQDQTSIDLTRSDSPPPAGYNSKRETNSTTSSTPSIGRNSTAATSIMSQPTSSAKDWQSTTTRPSSAAGASHLERTSTRTRRLYETGLNQDLQEHQSSALSRIDTLSRRNVGSRTPDMQNAPSPTSSLFSDRFSERRILAKGSAPNLRSASPLTTGSPTPATDLGITNPDPKPSFGGTPPLSPPISEGEEHSILPNDRGKATAMGLFQKPAHAYDESRYAQRQLQLQQGRETPTNRFRAESNASHTTDRSRSSSAQRLPIEKPEPAVQTEPTVKEEEAGVSFYNESVSSPDENTKPTTAAQGASRRPADRDHPALRESSGPTPSTRISVASAEPSPVSDRPVAAAAAAEASAPPQIAPMDSPTLPSSSGLSGMVRQHLRTDSTASSIYGPGPQSSQFASRFPLDPYDNKSMADLSIMANPWEAQSPDWRNSTFSGTGNGLTTAEQKEQPAPQPRQGLPSDNQNASQNASGRNAVSGNGKEREHDEFASQLADGARRVRERLTSYVESDRDSRSLSPKPVERVREPSLPRPNPLGILRQKTSRGSLIDRNRENRQDSQHSKAIKMLGLASSTISSAPSPNKSSFEDKEPPSPVHDERHKPGFPRSETTPVLPSQETGKTQEDESMHAGLRTFRQARMQLLEAQKTPSNVPTAPGQMLGSMAAPIVGPPASRTTPIPRQRSASRERRPPPITYQQRAPSEEPQPGDGSGRAERNRSGSEAGNGDKHRPARLRTGTGTFPQEDRGMGLNPGISPSGRSPMLQSPGLPGTNIRRSPIMPPQPYPKPLDRSASGNLAIQSRRRGPESGQPSPISPMAPIPSPSIPASQSTPSLVPSRRPSAPPMPSPNSEAHGNNRLDETMKRVVRKQDISEPTFVSSTSRVPTVSLPETSDSRSRSGSRARSGSILGAASSTPNLHATMVAHANAPPLPPINPKRRNMMSRRGEDGDASSPLSPPPGASGENGAFFLGDEDEGSSQHRLRKATSEANGMNMRARLPRVNSPPNMPSSASMAGGMI
ncbi:hypothetical protein CGRA01v4_13822 [Colletotrichum graminicola]|uniref:Glycosyl hydrolase family 43 protein n=1 Tax=Colletotrichum graminicola (strain M1.001 / M2 / FGSC 10212) TaxID=645133 RepID=E3QU30_COLGM|nr:uncharacterized protein GLRG_09512 [Colletotrichum graminicola M1.001]EFQ34368.1 hypothetical protein GLRG_09512 [Colletotrichum graminicola M1.001]WDK22532.1 hypothetical protein CGRA01v4_13822 [Colletotrichum graminicola]